MFNYRAKKLGTRWVMDVLPGECAHGNPVKLCLNHGPCAVLETEMLEDWLHDEPEDQTKMSGALLWPLLVIWSIFGMFVVANATTALRHGHYQQGICSLALFALMAGGAWFVRKK